jgi:hypothetical protein
MTTKRHVRLDDERDKPPEPPKQKHKVTWRGARDADTEAVIDTLREMRRRLRCEYSPPPEEGTVRHEPKTLREISRQDVLSPEDVARVRGYFAMSYSSLEQQSMAQNRFDNRQPFFLYGVTFEWRLDAYRRSHDLPEGAR